MACGATDGSTCLTTIFSTGITTAPIVTTVESILTTTRQIVTTCQATPGQTVTITPPPPPWYISPSSIVTPSTAVSSTTTPNVASTYMTSTLVTSSTFTLQQPTITVTEIVIVLESPRESVYSTSTITLPITTATLTAQALPSPVVVIISEGHKGGWDTWSDAQKGGLIAGCFVAFFVISFMITCCCARTRRTWVAHDWNAGGRQATDMAQRRYVGYGANRATVRGGEGEAVGACQQAAFYQSPIPR